MSILGLCLVGTISHIPPMYTLSRAILLIFFDPIILSLYPQTSCLWISVTDLSILNPQPYLFFTELSLSLSLYLQLPHRS